MNTQTITTSNFLIWDKIDKVPFPKETLGLVEKLDLKDTPWQTFGLPINFGKYSLLDGRFLYLEELPNGLIKIQKETFTGEIEASVFLYDKYNISNTHYIVVFNLIFFKGELTDIIFIKNQNIDKNIYQEGFKDLQFKIKKELMMKRSWFFKKIYIPWRFCINYIFVVLLFIVEITKFLLMKLLEFLTPL